MTAQYVQNKYAYTKLELPHLLHKISYTNSYYNHSSVKQIFPSVNTEQCKFKFKFNNVFCELILGYIEYLWRAA